MLVALGFLRLEGHPPPVLDALHRWLDTWRGIGDVAVGMHRQGYDLQLTEYDEHGWRATFYSSGMEHSATSATGCRRRGPRSSARRGGAHAPESYCMSPPGTDGSEI